MNALLVSQGIFPPAMRTLKSSRQMNANEMVRRQVPNNVISAYIIGHVTGEKDTHDTDSRIIDYAYNVGRSVTDICKILYIFSSGFKLHWENAHLAEGFDEFLRLMVKNMPDCVVMGYADEAEKADALLMQSKYEDKYKLNLAGDADDEDKPINLTPVAEVAPRTPLEPPLPVAPVPVPQPIVAIPHPPALPGISFYDLTGQQPVPQFFPAPYGYPSHPGYLSHPAYPQQMSYLQPQFYQPPPPPPQQFGIPQHMGSHMYQTPQPIAPGHATNISDSENLRRHNAAIAAAKAAGDAAYKAYFSTG